MSKYYFYTPQSIYSFKLESIKGMMKLNGYKEKEVFEDDNGRRGKKVTVKL